VRRASDAVHLAPFSLHQHFQGPSHLFHLASHPVDLLLKVPERIFRRPAVGASSLPQHFFALSCELLRRLVQTGCVQVIDGHAEVMHPTLELFRGRSFAMGMLAPLEVLADAGNSLFDLSKFAGDSLDLFRDVASGFLASGSLQFSQFAPQIAANFHQFFSLPQHGVQDFFRGFAKFLFAARPLVMAEFRQLSFRVPRGLDGHFQLVSQRAFRVASRLDESPFQILRSLV
jgi:hypothetical protein